MSAAMLARQCTKSALNIPKFVFVIIPKICFLELALKIAVLMFL